MKNLIHFILTFVTILTFAFGAQAQDTGDSTLYNIETLDGNEFIGYITFEDSHKIGLKTQNFGEITIQRNNIKSMTKVEQHALVEGEYWFENPQSTRYFWSPNAYGLRRGEGYYQNVWILFNQVAYGISDNISIGAGIVPLFLFAGAATPIWLTPRVSIPVVKDKFNVGGGALIGTVLGEEDTGFGVVYGSATFGSRDKNFNVGLGWGYTGESGLADSPTITMSGMIRTGARGYFLTENYLINAGDETLVLMSVGGRRIIKKVSLDFGLFVPFYSEMDTFVAVPWLGVVVPFGNTVKNQR